jgi:hypothetical protein
MTTRRATTGPPTEEVTFAVRRLTVPLRDFEDFQRRYEELVPPLPVDEMTAFKQRNAPWPEMLDLIADRAPLGFLIYDRNDVHPVMSLAGDDARCVAYLMGNHTIAERMFRHDPRAMLYAPLRTLIWEDEATAGWFTVDQPSTQFASFGIPEVATVGRELDRKLATLLEALGVDVPPALRT